MFSFFLLELNYFIEREEKVKDVTLKNCFEITCHFFHLNNILFYFSLQTIHALHMNHNFIHKF
jgi:hypothetical protein